MKTEETLKAIINHIVLHVSDDTVVVDGVNYSTIHIVLNSNKRKKILLFKKLINACTSNYYVGSMFNKTINSKTVEWSMICNTELVEEMMAFIMTLLNGIQVMCSRYEHMQSFVHFVREAYKYSMKRVRVNNQYCVAIQKK